MEEDVITVTVNKLKEGMILAKNIEQNGNILLSKGTVITKSLVEKLQGLYFFGEIEVYYNEEKSPEIENRIKTAKINKEFTELSIDLSKTFNNLIDENGKVRSECIDQVREFKKRIEKEIESTSIVIKNIVLYGSGEDSVYRHGVNVAALSVLLGNWIGISSNKLNLLVYSALLHDFGKTLIDKNILKKSEPLTKAEFKIVKSHPTLGYNYIKNIGYLDKSVSYGVLMHHERCDGSGYPLGISGDKIHTFARIIAIADVFDAINSNRGYKNKKLPFEAMQIIKNESLGKLDYEYSKVFLDHISNYYMGEEVVLNTGDICKIIQMNYNNFDKPLVLKDGDFLDLMKEKDIYVKEIII